MARARKARSLADEIGNAEIIEDGWEARIVCSPEAAKALRTATLNADPYLSASLGVDGVRLLARRTPDWPQLIERVKAQALATA